MSPTVDLTKTYLYAEGADLVRVNTETLWPRLMSNVPAGPAEERVANGSGWLIGVFQYTETWTSWEMHPEADEVVHVVKGRIEFVLDVDGREQRDAQPREPAREAARQRDNRRPLSPPNVA